MSRRLLPCLVALAFLLAACGGSASTSSKPTPAAGAASPAASPQGPTPTARIAEPAPSPDASPSPAAVAAASPSPVAAANPSPVAAASPSPVALASPVAGPSPVAGAAGSGGPLYRVVSERSEARYEVQEKFVERPLPNEAVGRTKDVTGEIVLERPGSLRGRVVQMRVDLRTLASDSGRRDNYVRQNSLQTDQFPFAEFRSTEPAGPEAYTEGAEATFQIPGVMTIKGRERPLTWDATVKLENGLLTGTARARIKLTDFGIEPPRLAILTVEDDMTWVIDVVAERAS